MQGHKPLKAILFDLEGTLVESAYQKQPEIIGRLRRATREKLLGLGVSKEALSGLVRSSALRNRSYQWTDDNLGREESERLRAEMEEFMSSWDMGSARQTVLYPDTMGALAGLSEAGVEMGIVTNTSSKAAGFILDNLRLRRFFRAVVTRSDVARLKPDPAMIHAAASILRADVGWLVGDSAFDAGAAVNAGLRSIIIRRDGRRPKFEHDCFIESLDEVMSTVLDA